MLVFAYEFDNCLGLRNSKKLSKALLCFGFVSSNFAADYGSVVNRARWGKAAQWRKENHVKVTLPFFLIRIYD